MLEQRPITQKVLAGAGAFAFVFSAAMAGTAFMISGGFGFGSAAAEGPAPMQLQHLQVVERQPSWDDGARYVIDDAGRVRSEDDAVALHESTAYSADDLDGAARGAPRGYERSEEEILRQIEREFLAPYGMSEHDRLEAQVAEAVQENDPYAAYAEGGYDKNPDLAAY
ncbi:MAG: hypothetical protein AB7P07_07255 [Hyphomonadaceae bacterium]